MANKRLFVKVTRELLPKVRDRFPFLYLEHGRLEVDDSSIKWIDSQGNVFAIPASTVSGILLGPGTSVTHDAMRTAGAANCMICWVGEDALLFYAMGHSPSANSRNYLHQIKLATDTEKATTVARRMFAKRFPKADLEGKSLKAMMGMEGYRVKQLYEAKAKEYGVGWQGRGFVPGKFSMSDITNQILTALNSFCYAICASAIHSMGYSMRAGFIHSGSPLPFVYDIADLYKDELCIDLAFSLTREMAGVYNKDLAVGAFRDRAVEINILERIEKDILEVLGRA